MPFVPGFLVSALAGVAGALVVAALSRRRRGGWAWTMMVGLLAGGLSGFMLYELGAGALGGAVSLYAGADARGAVSYAIGGAVGGGAWTVVYQALRSIVFSARDARSSRPRAADRLAQPTTRAAPAASRRDDGQDEAEWTSEDDWAVQPYGPRRDR